jgi:hypothetical protein
VLPTARAVASELTERAVSQNPGAAGGRPGRQGAASASIIRSAGNTYFHLMTPVGEPPRSGLPPVFVVVSQPNVSPAMSISAWDGTTSRALSLSTRLIIWPFVVWIVRP